ncbi:MAG: hypothetical protein AB1705_14790 [Verrucomicrobiota bacterium]
MTKAERNPHCEIRMARQGALGEATRPGNDVTASLGARHSTEGIGSIQRVAGRLMSGQHHEGSVTRFCA